jgi:hypothetical protein
VQRIDPRSLEDIEDRELVEMLKERRGLPVESAKQARLRGGGELALAENRRTKLRPARQPAKEVELRSRAGSGKAITLTPPKKKSRRVTFAFQPDKREAPGTVRAFDIAHYGRGGRLKGGMTVLYVNGPPEE